MNKITDKLLGLISEIDPFKDGFKGAYNIREDGQCAGRKSSEHIRIESKKDLPGLEIHIDSEAKGETVFIPACVTHGAVDDLVYNDFFVADGADVIITAGCGVHTEDGHDSRHNGIHRFFLGKGAHVVYKENHIGTGKGGGMRKIDPVTEVVLDEGAVLEMDTVQIGGVDSTTRKTNATLAARARLVIHERILTEKAQQAKTDFSVLLNGEDSAVDLV